MAKVESQPQWDGSELKGSIVINGRTIGVSADLDTIHRYAPGYNDALNWEIKRHAADIFEKLKPHFHRLHV